MAVRKLHIIIFLLMVLVCLLCGVSLVKAQKVEENDYFYVLNNQHGLSDNRILQMVQLPDQRLAVRTGKGINLYDSKHFLFISLTDEKAQSLSMYKGQTHLYADNHKKLWVKEYQKLFCIDLVNGKMLDHPLDDADDMFVDSKGNVWIVRAGSRVGNATDDCKVANTTDGSEIQLKKSWGALQDLDSDGKYVYAFFDRGLVAAFLHGKFAYVASAYSSSEARYYRSTSLTVQTPSGQFYQIRTGYDDSSKHAASVFLHFDPETRMYSKIFTCDYILHTLNMSSDNQALVSSQRGYLIFDFKIGNTPREVRELALPDGKSLVTGINTVYRDREGAIWLGTYNDGLIYVSPILGLFFTIDKPWWKSGWGITIGVVMVTVLVTFVVLYIRRKKRNVVKYNYASTGTAGQPIVVEAEPEIVKNIRSQIEQHLDESEYGVEQLAHDLCMERTGLYKKLMALTGTTPVAFIRQVRLQRAASLLKESGLTVNEIAERTGFCSPSYFTKCFKKEYGVLPSEFK